MELPEILYSRSRSNNYAGRGEIHVINNRWTLRDIIQDITPCNSIPAPDADLAKLKYANGFLCDAMALNVYAKDWGFGSRVKQADSPMPKGMFYRNAESARLSGENGRQVHAIDIDGVAAGTLDATLEKMRMSGYWFRLYTSASHSEEAECFRLMFVTDRPVSAVDGGLLRQAFAARWLAHIQPGEHPTKKNSKGEPKRTGIDAASWVIAQPMYLPWDGSRLYGDESDEKGLAVNADEMLAAAKDLKLKAADIKEAPEDLTLPEGTSQAVRAFAEELLNYGATPDGEGVFKTPASPEHASKFGTQVPSPDDYKWLLPNNKGKVLNVVSKHFDTDGEDMNCINSTLNDPLLDHMDKLVYACEAVSGQRGSKLETLAREVMKSIAPKKRGRPKKLDIHDTNADEEAEAVAIEQPEDTFDASTLHEQTLNVLHEISNFRYLSKLKTDGKPNFSALIKAGINIPAIDLFFRSTVWIPAKGQAVVLTPDDLVGDYSQKNIPRICRFTGDWVNTAALHQFYDEVLPKKDPKTRAKKVAEFTAAAEAEAKTVISDSLLDIPSQAVAIRISRDMFATQSTMHIDPRSRAAVYTRVFHPFRVGPVNEELLALYKSHFPQLDDFLHYLTAARFASDRKKAFLWMRMPSDWGKGFLTSSLQRLRIMTTIDGEALDKTSKDNTTGLDASDFIDAWAILVNEADTIRKSYRKLESEITLNPKFMMKATVPLYAKLFTSADAVKGLGSGTGVEKQLANRFAHWYLEGNIESLPNFTAIKNEMSHTLGNYAARYLNAEVERLQAMGKEAATSWADVALTEFHSRFGIAEKLGRMEDNFPLIFEEFRRWIEKQHDDKRDTNLDITIYPVVVDKATGLARMKLGLRSPKAAFEAFASSRYRDPNERDNVINSFASITGYKRNSVFKMNGKNISGLSWFIEEDEVAASDFEPPAAPEDLDF